VPSIELLSRDDLDEIGQSSFFLQDPFQAAIRLLSAVEQAKIAERKDIGYALLQAAEIYERLGDLETAELVVSRSVAAYRAFGDPMDDFPRAYRAELLLRLGREPAAMAEFHALRPLLTRDPVAVSYLSEALEMGGRADLAIEWLTEALGDLLGDGREEDPPTDDTVALVAYTVAQQRRRIRRDSGLAPDAYDGLADRLRDDVHAALDRIG
jgi:tetratricopeptide (TPR) repeat protein